MRTTLVIVAIAAIATGCGSREFSERTSIEISVQPEAISFAATGVGEEARAVFTVRNASSDGAALLKVAGIDVAVEDVTVRCGASNQLELVAGEQVACVATLTPSSPQARSGSIVVRSNADAGAVAVRVTSQALDGALEADPGRLNVVIEDGGRVTRPVRLRNVGFNTIEVTGWEISGGTAFALETSASRHVLEPFSASADEVEVHITYAPTAPGSDDALLRVFSDDPNAGILEVPLSGSTQAPCLLLTDGPRVDFGVRVIGELAWRDVPVSNCGNAPLFIDRYAPGDNAAVLGGGEGVFVLDAGDPSDSGGTLDAPIVIEPGDSDVLLVGFAPDAERPYAGTAFLYSNDPAAAVSTLELSGRGTLIPCPVAAATGQVQGGLNALSDQIEAAPLQTVVLDGSNSFADGSSVAEYKWELIQVPQDSAASLRDVQNEPGDPARQELFLDLAGAYVVELEVSNEFGTVSCEPTTVTILAVPTERVHIQLVWTNPEDPNEADLSGADVDLHLVRMGSGGWFDRVWDTYYRNPEPRWQPEHPSLDIDDTNGHGPENINMDDPEPCTWYAVGAHYFQDHGFGTAYVTVRIYLDNALVFELLNQPLLRSGEFWDVARIHWPTQSVYVVDEHHAIAPTNQHPAVTREMREAGLCGTP
jgi:hypothetical protein